MMRSGQDWMVLVKAEGGTGLSAGQAKLRLRLSFGHAQQTCNWLDTAWDAKERHAACAAAILSMSRIAAVLAMVSIISWQGSAVGPHPSN